MKKFAIGAEEWPGISKLVEECGEVLQVCGKLLGTYGDVKHWDGEPNLDNRLEDELGDLRAAITFVTQYCRLRDVKINLRFHKKLALFKQWHLQQTADFIRTPAKADRRRKPRRTRDKLNARLSR